MAPLSGNLVPPSSYKAASVTKVGGPLELIDIPWKDPEDGHIVVKILACGVCRSDELILYNLWPGSKLPTVPGHEIVGHVVSVPSSEKRWKVGDRVGSGWHGGHCHVCDQCRRGEFLACSNSGLVNGITRDGGYAEYATLRTEAVVSIPNDVDPAEVAPLLCAGLTTFAGIRRENVKAGDVVAIQGIGGLGHLAIQYSRAMGFRTVALSSGASKEKLAYELGAHHYFDASKVNQVEELQKLGGAKLIVATGPSPKIIQSLVDALGLDGTLLILALSPENMEISGNSLVIRRACVRGWATGTPKDAEECAAFSKLAKVRCYVQKYSLAEANEAFKAMSDGTAKFRSVIVP